jgi:VIT1/CCC1 family predicted Fe2+/Mn2+ transporter
MSDQLRGVALEQAQDELFAYRLYTALAQRLPAGPSRDMLLELARQEESHVDFWVEAGGLDRSRLRASPVKYRLLVLASRIVGPAFTIRWLERGEDKAIVAYKELLADGSSLTPEQHERVREMLREEEEHEEQLEQGVEDERRLYLGAAVLGVNDALVELTGALSGLISSIGDPKLIGFAGLIVGISASGAMAASSFLNVDLSVETNLNPRKAAAYTGLTYLIVVFGLVFPFFFLTDRHIALAITWTVAIAITAAFSYYSSVMQNESFRRRFVLMLALGLGVAVVSFGIGRVLGSVLGIESR